MKLLRSLTASLTQLRMLLTEKQTSKASTECREKSYNFFSELSYKNETKVSKSVTLGEKRC